MTQTILLTDLLRQLNGEGGLLSGLSEGDEVFKPDLHKPNSSSPPYLLLIDMLKYGAQLPIVLEQLAEQNLINSRVEDILQEPSYKPRLMRVGESLLLTLKFYQPTNQSFEHTEKSIEPFSLVAQQQIKTVRCCFNENLILIMQDGELDEIDTFLNDLNQNVGISTTTEALIQILEDMTQRFSEYIEDLHDDILSFEEKLLESELTDRSKLIATRKSLTLLRRNLAPIKDLVSRLAIEKLRWLEADTHQQLHDIAEHLRREIEEVDACIARTAIVSEELNTLITDNINKRLYIMSIVTVIFMPITFITGLFGVNLGGIPGNQSLLAFTSFTLLIFAVFVVIIFILKVKKWF